MFFYSNLSAEFSNSREQPLVQREEIQEKIEIEMRGDLTHAIKVMKTGTFYIWLDIQKEMILTETNVLLCATYIPPIETPYLNEDSFYILEGEINPFQALVHVLVLGEINSRTGLDPYTLIT